MLAFGPDFRRGFRDQAPVSNADVGVTMASILRLNLSTQGTLTGRVLTEAMTRGPRRVKSSSAVLASTRRAMAR